MIDITLQSHVFIKIKDTGYIQTLQKSAPIIKKLVSIEKIIEVMNEGFKVIIIDNPDIDDIKEKIFFLIEEYILVNTGKDGFAEDRLRIIQDQFRDQVKKDMINSKKEDRLNEFNPLINDEVYPPDNDTGAIAEEDFMDPRMVDAHREAEYNSNLPIRERLALYMTEKSVKVLEQVRKIRIHEIVTEHIPDITFIPNNSLNDVLFD